MIPRPPRTRYGPKHPSRPGDDLSSRPPSSRGTHLLPARRILGRASVAVALDQTRIESLEVGRRQKRKQLPGEVERLLDAPSPAGLVDERMLEALSEGQVAPIVVGERGLADDRYEPAQFAPTGKCGIELVGSRGVLGSPLWQRRALAGPRSSS